VTAKKKTNKKPKAGRPSKFEKVAPKIKLLSRRGFTDAEIAQLLDVTQRTLDNWKKRHDSFFRSLNDWKKLPDKQVERSLFERACGYSHPETKVFTYNGKILTYEVIKHYPPDPTSMIFWLKNRQRARWRDKIDHDISGDIGIKGLSEALSLAEKSSGVIPIEDAPPVGLLAGPDKGNGNGGGAEGKEDGEEERARAVGRAH